MSGNPQGQGDGGKDFSATVQSLLGALVAGFAAILSFLGIRSSELTSILRNDEPLIPFIGLPFLLSIFVAIWSIFAGDVKSNGARNKTSVSRTEPVSGGTDGTIPASKAGPAPSGNATDVDRPGWPRMGFAIFSLLLVAALMVFVPRFIQIPFVTTPAEARRSAFIGSVLIAVIAIIWLAVVAIPVSRKWSLRSVNIQLYLVLMSVLLLSISAYSALRLESASQGSPFAQLDGGVRVIGKNYAVLSLSISSAKVTSRDGIIVTVTALPRRVNTKSLCKKVKAIQRKSQRKSLIAIQREAPCPADPCFYEPRKCRSLADWDLPPNAAGGVQEVLTFPFSPHGFQRLHIEDLLCVDATARGRCGAEIAGTHLDVRIPRGHP
jgi:hypothetical protein